MSSIDIPSVSVIVPVAFGGKRFQACLASLAAALPPPEEIIVVADGDTDGAWQEAKKIDARVIVLPENRGPANARNVGAKCAQGEILFFVDADVIIPKDAVGLVAAAFQKEQDFAAVFGSYDDDPPEPNFLSQYKNLLHHYVHQISRTEAFTFWAACGGVRRDIFMEMGGFDTTYRHPSIEDIELGYRLKKAGYRILMEKNIQITHLKRWDAGSLLKTDFYYRAVPWTDLILREGRFADDLNLTISSRMSVVFVYVLLFMMVGIFFWKGFVIPALILTTLLFTVNRELYRFFKNKRGWVFALKTVPWHWFYFFYSGLAFAWGYASYRFRKPKPLEKKSGETP
jgi:GT2 family glycosyltransferase